MAVASDFVVIRDEQFLIGVAGNDDETFGFKLPGELASRKEAVLFWLIDTEDWTFGRAVEILLNDEKLTLTADVTGSVYRTQHEILTNEPHDTAVLNAGVSNHVRFSVVGGFGPVKISDVVLWFRRTV